MDFDDTCVILIYGVHFSTPMEFYEFLREYHPQIHDPIFGSVHSYEDDEIEDIVREIDDEYIEGFRVCCDQDGIIAGFEMKGGLSARGDKFKCVGNFFGVAENAKKFFMDLRAPELWVSVVHYD